jgi:uncharacterized protein
MQQETHYRKTSFDVVVKVAERCNLACKYCYYYFQEYDGNKSPAFITKEAMEELPRFLLRSVEQLNIDRLNIGFHGGEPLLLKKAVFDEFCSSLRRQLDDKVRLFMAVQTNGVLIDDDWIDLFEKHQIGVGVSIDGNKPTHDKLRVDHAGRGSYDAAVRGLKLLQAAACKGRLRGIGALGVVNATGGDKALEHLIVDLGVRSPNINFPRDGWDSPQIEHWVASDSHRKMVQFALDKLVYPKFHLIRGLTNILLTLQSDVGARFNDRHASQRHYIATISSEGRLFCDDNVLSVDESLSQTDLTIFGTSLKDLLESPEWQRLNDAIGQVPEECRSCEWYRSCRGGELFNRFSKADGYSRKSVLCDTIKMIHEEIASYLVSKSAVSVIELSDRLTARPTTTSHDMLVALTTRPPQPAAPPPAPAEVEHQPQV